MTACCGFLVTLSGNTLAVLNGDTLDNLRYSRFFFAIRRFYVIFAVKSFDEINMKLSKRLYILIFFIVTAVLAVMRLLFPSIATSRDKGTTKAVKSADYEAISFTPIDRTPAAKPVGVDSGAMGTKFYLSDGSLRKSRIFSVPGYERCFPDQNDVQLVAAQQWGVKPVADSAEASKSKKLLVYVGANPYFYVDRLRNSIPYLVPRAAVLLQDIGRNFYDSLQVKGIPLHKIIVTSIMRSKKDVAALRKKNRNATENSCHLYGTTFDVCYNRYKTVQAPGEHRREVRNDTLKYVLAEVMRDMRERNRCYIKYEVHQGCWHITVR